MTVSFTTLLIDHPFGFYFTQVPVDVVIYEDEKTGRRFARRSS